MRPLLASLSSHARDLGYEPLGGQPAPKAPPPPALRVEHAHEGGGCVRVTAIAVVPLRPDALFEILVHPDAAAKVFSGTEGLSYRRVVSAGPPRRLDVVQAHAPAAALGFLPLRGRWDARLKIVEDAARRVKTFELVPGGSTGCGAALRVFEGRWAVTPNPADPTGRSSVHTLVQRVAVRGFVPPGGAALVGRACAGRVRALFDDVAAEAARIGAGRGSLTRRYESVKDEEWGALA